MLAARAGQANRFACCDYSGWERLMTDGRNGNAPMVFTLLWHGKNRFNIFWRVENVSFLVTVYGMAVAFKRIRFSAICMRWILTTCFL